MISVNWSELLDAFEFASAGGEVFVDLDTGVLHYSEDEFDVDVDDESPEAVETSGRNIALPHKNDLDLGRSLVLAFVAQNLPADVGSVAGYFRARGAYRRFKDLLQHRNALEAWYAFEKEATEKALMQWCADHEIAPVFDPAV